MKTTILAIVALAVSAAALRAESTVPSYLGASPELTSVTTPATDPATTLPSSLTLAQASDPAPLDLKLPSNSSSFAQLSTTGPVRLSSGFIMALVAAFVLTLRVMGLNHARAMAEHERDSYHGKDKMFRALQEDGSRR